MRTMGDELVSSEVVAVIELVKNAYDADASRVMVRFDGDVVKDVASGKMKLVRKEGRIEILDDGCGMSSETLMTVWMEPATGYKRRNKFSTKGRRVVGEKGIGRFASSRLANELLVITREEREDVETQVIFDWTQFDNEDKYLDEVEVLWASEYPRDIKPGGAIEILWQEDKPTDANLTHGTILRMDSLRDDWDEDKFIQLRTGLARLVSPFSQLEDFHIFLELPLNIDSLSGRVDPPGLLQHPNYTIKGSVDGYGRYSMDIRILGDDRHLSGRFKPIAGLRNNDQIKDDDPLFEEKAEKSECGPFEIELRVWDRDTESLEETAALYGSTLQDVRRDLDAIAGINIYRDDFRVLPYGEPRNDWLRLDLRRTQNTSRLYNSQITGYISIGADRNPNLRDQSSREGIVSGLALRQFEELTVQVIALLEPLRFIARNPTKSSARATKGGIFEGFDLRTVYNLVVSRYPNDLELIDILRDKSDDLDKRVTVAQDVLARYRRLATLGQLIDTVLHEGRAPLSKIGDRADTGMTLIRKAHSNDCDELLPKLGTRFEAIVNQSNVLATVFRRIEPFGGRKRGRPSEVIFEEIISDSFEVFHEELRRENIQVDFPGTEHLVTVDSSEIQQVFVNLINNSLYWLQQVPKDSRKIKVEVHRISEGELEIIFSDSGPGIEEEHRPYIFDPYFSQKPDGVGLGLALAGEIVTDYYHGNLELLDSGPLRGATFRITLRRRV